MYTSFKHDSARTYPAVDLSAFAPDKQVDLYIYPSAGGVVGWALGYFRCAYPPELIEQDPKKLVLEGAGGLVGRRNGRVRCCVLFDEVLDIVIVDVVFEEAPELV